MGIRLENLTAMFFPRIVFRGDTLRFRITVSNLVDYDATAHIHAEDDQGNVWAHLPNAIVPAKSFAEYSTEARTVTRSFTLTVTVTDPFNHTDIKDEKTMRVIVLPISRIVKRQSVLEQTRSSG